MVAPTIFSIGHCSYASTYRPLGSPYPFCSPLVAFRVCSSAAYCLESWSLGCFLLAKCFPWSSSLVLLHLSQHCPSPRVPSHSPSHSLISLAFPRSGVAASAMPDILLLPAHFRLPQLCFMSLMALAPSPILALLGIWRFLPLSIGLLSPSVLRSSARLPHALTQPHGSIRRPYDF
jgi:hypothetical protein